MRTAMRRAARVSRCRVCHREMTNPAHVAAGIGPECAKRKAAGGRSVARPAYPAAKMARIERNVNRLATMLDSDRWTPEARALVAHWLRRWRDIQARVQAA